LPEPQAAIVFVDAFVERIRHAETIAGFKRGSVTSKKGLDGFVGEEGRV